MKSSWSIPFAVMAGGIIIALAIYYSAPKTASPLVHSTATLVRPIGTQDHILGNPTAKVIIVEYADFDCEYCSGFDDIVHQVIASEAASGEVAWVFREFPLIEVHKNAMAHAEAAECAAIAGGNEGFWRFADTLFTHQPVNPSNYGALAQGVDIPSAAFASCYSNASSTVVARIEADRQNALDIGAPGAPYTLILVEGQAPLVLSGAYSYDALKQLVDQALASAD